ncbi:hypothetical protein B0H21DRAFT_773339, partial [Amylocystis lapponica]
MFCTNVSLHPWKPWCLCSAAIMIVLPLHPTQIVVVTSSAFIHILISVKVPANPAGPPREFREVFGSGKVCSAAGPCQRI